MIEMFMHEWATIPEMLGVLLSWQVIAAIVVGMVLGITAGALPGLTATMAMALLLGFIFVLPFELGWALLIAVYVGAIKAGGITALMINIPGTPASVATCFDGFPLAQKGKAREAVGLVVMGSALGAILGTIALYLLLPIAAALALLLGSWELALVCFIAIILAGTLAGKNPIKGLASGALGLIIAMVGIEPIFGYPRFHYHPILLRGFTLVPVLIGLFGISEVLSVLQQKTPYKLMGKPARAIIKLRELKNNTVNIIRSALIGTGIGILPGIGESVAPLIAYSFAQRASKTPDEFGKGCVEGVVAPEVANNAVAGGALIPTMVLGIPGSGPAAILLAALFIFGYRPGPILIMESPGILTLTVMYFLLAVVVMIVVGIGLSSYIIRLLYMPREIMLPIVVVLCVLGAWAAHFTLIDVTIMFFFGLLGYALRAREYPLAPLILGVLVGGLFDEFLRRALLIHGGITLGLLMRPASLILLGVLMYMIYTVYKMARATAKE